MKCASIGVLGPAVLGLPTASFQALLKVVICVAAFLALIEAVRLRRYFWAAGFCIIAVLFNPVIPVALSRRTLLWLDWVCLMTFLLSLAALKKQPTLSVPEAMNRRPRSQ